MKNILIFLSLLLSFVYAEALTESVVINEDTIYVRAVTETHLDAGYPITQLRFDVEYLKLDLSKVCENHGVTCSNSQRAYYSSLDSTVAVFFLNNGFHLLNRHRACYNRLDTIDCYPFAYEYPQNLTAIIKDEFLKLQEWGAMDISKDSATTLIERIITYMKMGPNFDEDSVSIYANDPTKGNLYGAVYTHRASCDTGESLCLAPSLIAVGPMLPYTTNDKINKNTLMNQFIVRTSKNTFAFSGEQHFYLYDLNGVLLKSGYAKSVYIEKFPVILKFKNGASFLLK